MSHMDHLATVSAMDIVALQEKEKTYGGSWKKRGGSGAFFVMCRKWDRLENILSQMRTYVGADKPPQLVQAWDIFGHIQGDPSGVDGTVLDQVRDLRRYLMLIEAEMISQGVVNAPSNGGLKVSPMDPKGDGSMKGPDEKPTIEWSERNDPKNFDSKLPKASPGIPYTLVGVRARIQELERDPLTVQGVHDKELEELRDWEKRLMAKPVPAEDSNKHALQEDPDELNFRGFKPK